MAWASTAPAAILALVNGFTIGLAPTRVINGQLVSSELLGEAVTVAWQNDLNPQAVTGVFADEGFGSAPDRDRYTVNCAVSVVTGNDDYLPARARVFELLALAGGVLAADRTLGGLVMRASLAGPWWLTELPGPTDTALTLPFGVAVDAFAAV